MRKALNENPMVQLAVLAVVGVILVFMVFTRLVGGEDPPAADPAATAPADASAAAAADPAAIAAAPAPAADAAAIAPAPAPDPVQPPGGLKAGDGLPKDVLAAFEDDKAVALLVVDPKGFADERILSYAKRLEPRDDAELFVVDVEDVGRYSQITSGLAVSRTPALIAIQPRKQTDGVPTATVSYGFRSQRSVEQAIDDALYDDGTVPAYP